MDMKEKLVELLDDIQVRGEDFTDYEIYGMRLPDTVSNEDVASHLIARGVTVQDNTEISEELLKQLRNAPVTILQEEPTIEVVQKWISVKDRLPIEEAKAYEQEWCEEYPEFIVMIERGLLPTTLYYDWENNEWFRINTTFERETYKVTHWMPLPQPPKGE